MVKLIRITTRATDGSFETAFRSPVNIKENSKVALQNLIMAVQEKAIIIDGTNDQMFFSVSGGNVRNVFLTRASYDKVNAKSGLLQDIADKLNGGLTFGGSKELGCQWRVSFGTRITIANAFSRVASYVSEFNQNAPAQAVGSNTRLVALSSGTNPLFVMSQNAAATGAGAARGDNEASNFLNEPVCKGTGFIRAKIHTLVDDASVATSGFLVGFVKGEVSSFFQGNPPVSTGQFLEKDMFYGVHINQVGQPIRIIKEGNFSNTASTPTGLGLYAGEGNDNNAIVACEVLNNIMRIKIYYNGGEILLDSINATVSGKSLDIGTQKYTPFITFRGAHDRARTTRHQFLQDPFVANPNLTVESDHHNLGLPAPPTQVGVPNLTLQEVGFTSADLANELGYVPQRFPPVNSSLLPNLTWTAQNDFEVLTVNDNYMVILDNHYLDCYDSLEKGQRSIVAVLPVKDDIGAIRFDANNPIFIDMNNKLPLSMRNIRMRIVRADGTQVNSIGLSTATLLIQE